MDAKGVLRTLIIGEWVLLIVNVVLEINLQSTLPAPLRSYVEQQINTYPTALDSVILFTLILMIASSIGLFVLARWAPPFYVVSVLLGLLTFLPEPQVATAWGTLVGNAGGILSGVIIGMLYFPSISQLFTTSNAKSSRATGVRSGA